MKDGAGQGKSKEVGSGHIGSGQVGGGRARKMSGKIRKIRGKKRKISGKRGKTREDAKKHENHKKSGKPQGHARGVSGAISDRFKAFGSLRTHC